MPKAGAKAGAKANHKYLQGGESNSISTQNGSIVMDVRAESSLLVALRKRLVGIDAVEFLTLTAVILEWDPRSAVVDAFVDGQTVRTQMTELQRNIRHLENLLENLKTSLQKTSSSQERSLPKQSYTKFYSWLAQYHDTFGNSLFQKSIDISIPFSAYAITKYS